MRIICLVAVAALTISLGSCAALQKLSSTEVPSTAISAAAESVNVAETSAKNYIVFCSPNPAPKGCDDSLIKTKIVPAVKNVRVARDAARTFIANNPNSTLGPATLVSGVTTAVSALQTILTQNSIPSASN
ncbi:hypothetical protein G6L15_08690 [Agrobacterium rhizogenes]|uniref:hypothetical protein n=1 Tax=Rhizobium rhizogenes TaxID=359 RepID=UPI001571C8EB|nr:hypothetical protein [Rhizobium rhizogenes]NTG86222.1 hypothetical protein [Rhizobium rhizogenes]